MDDAAAWKQLEGWREDPASVAILTDIDGTLAPIVPTPDMTERPSGRTPEGRLAAGTSLAQSPHHVADAFDVVHHYVGLGDDLGRALVAADADAQDLL